MKSILASKTFWVNIIAATLGCLTLFTPDWFTGIGLTDPHKQALALGIIGVVTTVLNLVVRILTKQPVDAGAIGAIIQGIVALFPKKKT